MFGNNDLVQLLRLLYVNQICGIQQNERLYDIDKYQARVAVNPR